MSRRNAAPRIEPIGNTGPATTVNAHESSRLTNALTILDSYRRDKLLEAVASAAKDLLRSADLTVSLPAAIERIGEASGVDRAHIILIDPASRNGTVAQHYVWTVPGLVTPPEFQHATTPMGEMGLKSWIPRLRRGEIITGHIRDFDSAVRSFFELGGIKSTLCVPIFAEGQWSGMIAFDDCGSERDWSAVEIDTVGTLAEMVGAAITRTSHLKKLADGQRIIENSSTILFRLGPEAPYPLTFISQNIERYGYQANELLGHSERWTRLIDDEDKHVLLDNIVAISEGKKDSVRTEFRLQRPDGSIAWFDGFGAAVHDDNNRIVAIEGIITDITDRKSAETSLSFSHILLTTALESSPDAILVVDINNRIIKFNQHFADLWQIPPKDMLTAVDGVVLQNVASQMKDESAFMARVRYLYEHPELPSHEEIETKDGRIIDRHSDSLYDPQRKYLGRVWFFRDVTGERRAADKMTTLARTDALTGLANRATFLERLGLEFARAKRGANNFALHYLDLDHFKDVNDTLGHPVGDKLLREVADRLKGCVRNTDLVARFGGDEFAVLQDGNADSASIETLAAKIGAAIAAPYFIEDSQIQTTASIGVVPYSSDIAGVDAMMMKADLALYRAKNEGRNQFRFHVQELDEQTRERMIIGEELRHAIKRGEFELFYQPQVDLTSNRIVGVEALVRWNHPKRGLILPSAFIPIAETTGTIVPIGEWVVENACRQIRAWNNLGIAPSTVAVNLSGAQFRLASRLDELVTDALARHDVAPQQLEIELTESVLLETTQRHREAFDRLRKIGVRLAIDDFGTGYSSLDYLRSFRVSRLKVDPSFIADVATNADDAAIVRATIGLAHELGIEVVAEGVETRAQRDFLVSATCKFAQGYYFGKPAPAAATSELLRRDRDAAAA